MSQETLRSRLKSNVPGMYFDSLQQAFKEQWNLNALVEGCDAKEIESFDQNIATIVKDMKTLAMLVPYVGYVKTEDNEYMVQLPNEKSPWGFSLHTLTETWPGGVGLNQDWGKVEYHRGPHVIREQRDTLITNAGFPLPTCVTAQQLFDSIKPKIDWLRTTQERRLLDEGKQNEGWCRTDMFSKILKLLEKGRYVPTHIHKELLELVVKHVQSWGKNAIGEHGFHTFNFPLHAILWAVQIYKETEHCVPAHLQSFMPFSLQDYPDRHPVLVLAEDSQDFVMSIVCSDKPEHKEELFCATLEDIMIESFMAKLPVVEVTSPDFHLCNRDTFSVNGHYCWSTAQVKEASQKTMKQTDWMLKEAARRMKDIQKIYDFLLVTRTLLDEILDQP